MKEIDVLIVEDEPNIAEVNSFYISRMNRFRPVGIASSIADARKMIKILKPTLILLDNYLPDGLGIDLLKELISEKHTADVIFITAASDMDTVRESVRSGVFDYLLKPIAYDRLQDSLERYLKYMGSIQATDDVNQHHVDELFNFQSKSISAENLPKGIDELTLQKLKDVFIQSKETYTAGSLSEKIGMSKTTTRRYLEYLVSSSFLVAEIQYGKIGRPERIYQKK